MALPPPLSSGGEGKERDGRSMHRRRRQGGPCLDYVAACPLARSTINSEQTQAVKGKEERAAVRNLIRSHSVPPSPPACAPPLSGAA